MGKWSTYRKRGRTTGFIPLEPPPAPVLSTPGGYVRQTAAGVDDSGGTIELWSSIDDGAEWEQFDVAAWEAAHTWGTVASFGSCWLRACEVGNGAAYGGQSDWSNCLVLL